MTYLNKIRRFKCDKCKKRGLKDHEAVPYSHYIEDFMALFIEAHEKIGWLLSDDYDYCPTCSADIKPFYSDPVAKDTHHE